MAATAEAVDTTQTLLNVNMSNVTKLAASNYVMWSLQVHALFDGYDLTGYLDGSTPPPAPTITANGTKTVNPAFTKWKHQDKLIYSGLLGALSLTVQPLVSTTQTAAEIWRTLAATYVKPSRRHIQQLRHQLKQCSKSEKTIDEYLQGMITRFDQLALLGKPINHENQIEYILGGLPEDYKSVIEQIKGRDISPSITKIHEKLLNKEAILLSVTSAPSTVVPISANTRPRQSQGKQNQRQS